jgi:hypothetical protein
MNLQWKKRVSNIVQFWEYFLFEYWGVESILRSLGTAPTTGLLFLLRVIVRMKKLVEWTILAGETEVLKENLPWRYKSHCQTRARTGAAAVGSQRLTASAMARPYSEYYCFRSVLITIFLMYVVLYIHETNINTLCCFSIFVYAFDKIVYLPIWLYGEVNVNATWSELDLSFCFWGNIDLIEIYAVLSGPSCGKQQM